jgi:hypothetical protein
MSPNRIRMRDAARLAMLDEMMRGPTLPGAAVRRAFGGLDAALRAVFAMMDEQEAATRAATLAVDHDSMEALIKAAQLSVETAA